MARTDSQCGPSTDWYSISAARARSTISVLSFLAMVPLCRIKTFPTKTSRNYGRESNRP